MVPIPFDVNNQSLRNSFFSRDLSSALASLHEEAAPLWGSMSAQQMVEHLLWAFQCSTGTIELPCRTPSAMIERVKTLLYDERSMPRNFKNPLLESGLPPLRFSSLADAKDALTTEVQRFITSFQEEPSAVRVHPVFGPLGAEEWHRAQFKHTYHHLLQFGLVTPGNHSQSEVK